MALPIVPIVEFNFEVLLHNTILVYLVQEFALDPRSVIDFNVHTQIIMLFEAVEVRKHSSPEKFETTLQCLIFHSEDT